MPISNCCYGSKNPQINDMLAVYPLRRHIIQLFQTIKYKYRERDFSDSLFPSAYVDNLRCHLYLSMKKCLQSYYKHV